MSKTLNRPLKLCGQSLKPGATTTVTVLEYDSSDKVLKCSGASVPSSEAGYAVGCQLINTSTGHMYINEGTVTSCTFNDVGAIAASEIALAEGSILVGNSSAVSVALNAKTDGRILVGNGTTVTSVAVSGDATLANTGALTVTKAAGNFGVEAGKIALNLSGGAASASGLLMGVGTTANPAATAAANNMFAEFRTRSTATSGDSRGLYWRHELSGAGVSGESVRAFTKVSAACATARGAHFSLDVNTTGSVTGLGAGVDAQLLVPNQALGGGTYGVVNSEIYSAGSSSSVEASNVAFFRAVASGDATGIATVDTAGVLFSIQGLSVGSGKLFQANTAAAATHALKIKIGGTPYYIMLTDTGA